MTKNILVIVILCLFSIISGCSRGIDIKEKELDKEIHRLKDLSRNEPFDFSVHTTSAYDTELGCINRKDRLWQDIIVETKYYSGGVDHWLYFYNYGKDIKLFKKMMSDMFILPFNDVANIELLYRDYFVINKLVEDEKYGTSALGTYINGNRVIEDVFMTPMAYREYAENDIEELIFVQFEDSDEISYKNIIFRGGLSECYYLLNHYADTNK